MSEPVLRLTGVGKMYKIFPSPLAAFLEAAGIQRRQRYREFWALRDIDLELTAGDRLGVIGRNGAGKSTLLKLITQNVEPTEGEVLVNGEVQALLEMGGGLHPEFTGRENVQAALGLLGLSRDEIARTEREIAEFTELGQFLDQPFKTFSAGMQARLAFAVATSFAPEILIVDEILGAGDAYFFAKSTERMMELIDHGAAVLLVSHALDQIMRFCEETIWIDRGRIVMRGPSTEVAKAYEKFIRDLDDRRLQAKNRKLRLPARDAFERDTFLDVLHLTLGAADVTEIVLLRDGEVEDRLVVGDAQDTDTSQSSFVLEASGWTGSVREETRYFRTIPAGGHGFAAFNLWFFYPNARYAFEIVYRAQVPVDVSITRGQTTEADVQLPASSTWRTAHVILGRPSVREEKAGGNLSRWPGSRSLVIDGVRLVGDSGAEQAVFETESRLVAEIEVLAQEGGTLPLVPAVLIFRPDGLVVTRHVSTPVELDVRPGDSALIRLDFGPLLLGNGTYLLSVGLYRRLDIDDVEPSLLYDYLDRSFEFRVVGNPALHNEIVRHPGEWQIELEQRVEVGGESIA